MTPRHGRRIDSPFNPSFLLRNKHLQTILPSMPFAAHDRVSLSREILTLHDGDETAVDWAGSTDQRSSDRPLLVILHGLESSSESTYAQMLMHNARAAGWDTCVMNFRDCGDYRNRLPRRYHAGETGDVRFFLEQQANRRSGPIVAVGYSLGGNVLLKYLGESGDGTPLSAAAAVCVPLDLKACSSRLNRGFSKIYQYYLLRNMKTAMRKRFSPDTAGIDWVRAINSKTFDDFDDAVTAPLHGFDGKDDYYGKSSSRQFLGRIKKPTLIVNALDDPFMDTAMLPSEEELAPAVTLELSEHGGHVGYIEAGPPWRPRYYLPNRLVEYLRPFTER
ncbi:MAG: hydrolase [Pseudomonadota bacterium]